MVRQHPDANIHRAEQEREAKKKFEKDKDEIQRELAEKRSGTYVLRVVDDRDHTGAENEFIFDAWNLTPLRLWQYKEYANECEWIDMSGKL